MRSLIALLVAIAGFASVPAVAELPVGAKAPVFVAATAKAGKAGRFNLAKALQKGPVVLYFYPKAFTQGCTLEAHAFAEATDDFARAGATVLGMSADDLATLKRFSVEACRDKFAVGVASPKVIAAYDVAMGSSGMTNRTSYVIGQDGRVAFVHSDRDYREHVSRTLAAVKAMQAARP
ncbi:MAG: peroxiredoxin [Novosphingobium sp.]|nr:peroxiredoxin [Novosphingobium sp.]